MTLRAKLSLVIILEIIAMVTLVGIVTFRQSRSEIQSLARELLKARTEYAFTLCELYNDLHGQPAKELIRRIQSVRIAHDGYIAVISNAAETKGVLVIHPNSVGVNINNPRFPHIQRILEEIDASGGANRVSNFIHYHQGTDARGRQGEAKIGYYMYFAPWHWVVLSTGYEKDVYGSTDAVLHRVTEAIILVGLISLIILNLTLVKMFRPMRQLISATKSVAAGNLDTKIEIESKDEIGGLATHFNHMLESLRENTRIWQELEIARRLQQEMLPEGKPHLPGVRIEAISLPATEVGGDFYDFIPLDDNRFALIIGDVSGKGMSGAIGMSCAISSLRFSVDERQHTDEMLTLANHRLLRDIQRYMFVAVFLGIYDRNQRQIFYTNAGQTMPLLCRNGRVDFLTQSDQDRFPLGIRPNVVFSEQMVQLQPGDLLVCYTDGIVELANGEREPYGFDRFKSSLAKHAHKPLEQIAANVIAEAQAYVAGAQDYNDDITLVLVKIL
ncbi:MAG: HAMP domain-containing protein [Calditrichaeota bacterium]|nr:MAG: HAMP domain-containing protein [Calditrichota bacterium]